MKNGLKKDLVVQSNEERVKKHKRKTNETKKQKKVTQTNKQKKSEKLVKKCWKK